MLLNSALKPINFVVTILMILSAIASAYFAITGGPIVNFRQIDCTPYLLFFAAIFIFSLLLKWLIVTIIKNNV